MLKRCLFPVMLLGLAALFFMGVGRLCLLRFRTGDVYPPLSSLRGDPLGAKAFYDAMEETGELKIHRNYRPLHKLRSSQTGTLFYLGADLNGATEDWQDLWQLATQGNRVVITFVPMTSAPAPKPSPKPVDAKKSPPPDPPKDSAKKETQKDADGEPKKDPLAHLKWISWQEALKRAGVITHTEKKWESVALKARPAGNTPASKLEAALSWHSVAWLELTGTNRKALYECSRKPVIAEVAVGKGSFVFATDSYFLTNEALRKERAPRLLAALIGENSEVIFDESHLNSVEVSGISTLIRQYRLEGVFVVFALLAALYVWKNATPLLPRAGESNGAENAEQIVAGRNATEGFVNLLRRAIPPGRIIGVCVEEWNNAFAHQKGKATTPTSGDGPATQFSELAQKLSTKRTRS